MFIRCLLLKIDITSLVGGNLIIHLAAYVFKMAAPVRLLMLLFFLTIFGIGIYDMIINVERNACEMTYMFTTPEYLVILSLFFVLIAYLFTECVAIDLF